LRSKTGWKGRDAWCIRSNPKSVQSNRASLEITVSTMRTRSRNDDEQIYVSSTGQSFFSRVPNGVFNLVTSFFSMEEFGRLHWVLRSNKLSKSHWERNLRQYAHHSESLFNTFTSTEALRWVLFVRNIDARGWELYLRNPKSSGNQTEYLSHGGSFLQACEAGELDIVKAVDERTQVSLETRGEYGKTPLHSAAVRGHLPVVQYPCEQGGDKEARDVSDWTPLHMAALNGHLSLWCSTCVNWGLTRRRGM